MVKWGRGIDRMRETVGWDIENVPDRESSESLFVWEDLQRIFPYLWHEERVLLSLLRDGKTYSDIERIQRYKSHEHAKKAIERARAVAAFYAEHIDSLERLPSVISSLGPRYRKVLAAATIDRESFADIAHKMPNMNSPTSAAWCYERGVRMLEKNGEKALAGALRACYAMPTLRKTSRCPTRRTKAVDPWRDELKHLILSSVGRVWYEWGGQQYDPIKRFGYADCSGLTIEVLKIVHKLPPRFRDTTAAGLRKYFSSSTVTPLPGDLVFYGRDGSVSHVMFYVGAVNGWDHAVAGMCGGRRGMSRDEAMLLGANLWVRPSRWYRSDFIGCRRVR